MSISLYSGTPGSGKSLHAAQFILQSIKAGKNVIANFDMDFSKLKRKKRYGHFWCCENDELTVDALLDFARLYHKPRKESQTIVVIDECADMFNCRDWARKDRSEWMRFLCQHRKVGYDIILISQQDRMLDKQVRGLIEMEYKHRAVKNFKFFGFLISKILGGLFLYVEYWYVNKSKCSSTFFRYHKKYDDMYDTYKIFS